jgi:uncharacterized protein YkwD
MRSPRFSLAFLLLVAVLGTVLSAPPAEKTTDKPATEKKVELTRDEQAVLELTNEARAKEKLPPLKFNAVLTQCARAHSTNQARQKKMAHELDGKSPSDRVEASGYDYQICGENVAFTSPPLRVKTIFKAWMESPHHRSNILDKDFTEIGIGVIQLKDNEDFYLTQVFGSPRP